MKIVNVSTVSLCCFALTENNEASSFALVSDSSTSFSSLLCVFVDSDSVKLEGVDALFDAADTSMTDGDGVDERSVDNEDLALVDNVLRECVVSEELSVNPNMFEAY